MHFIFVKCIWYGGGLRCLSLVGPSATNPSALQEEVEEEEEIKDGPYQIADTFNGLFRYPVTPTF